MEAVITMSRKERRKERKKMKRKKARKEAAEKEREEVEVRLNDPEEQRKLKETEEEENQRMEKERLAFEEREMKFLEESERKRKKLLEEEEEERRRVLEEHEEEKENKKYQVENDEDDDWEYVEEGPAEIIWQGNEIIVRKKRVKVLKKKNVDQQRRKEDDRPTSNPLPPQSEAFADYQTASAERMFENVAQQIPNFGTEQDKAHCPFHLKTGACRFGQRCSRVHFYPDKAHTLLMKNMYNGPGIAWEQDEGLEYTDEEVERYYEEFYEDVHTEFLKYGEIVNFKVCKNSSFHLRGNVYVHYKSLDSALLAYQSFSGRYFAGKQITCEFVNVTRWKVAICGEYMKSRLKMCSRGMECNFIHCFRNPGGDYEWADWDKPPPRYWIKKMIALFGYSDEYAYEKQMEQEKFKWSRMATKIIPADSYRHRGSRSRSRDINHSLPCSGKSSDKDDDDQDNNRSDDRKRGEIQDGKSCKRVNNRSDSMNHHDSSSEGGLSDRDCEVDKKTDRHHHHARKELQHVSEVTDCSKRRSTVKIRDGSQESDSDGGRSKQKKHAEGSGHRTQRAQRASLDDCRDRESEFSGKDGYQLGSEKRRSQIGRSSRDHSKRRHADDFGDCKDSCSINEMDKRDHTRGKSSRHHGSSSEFLDDYQEDGYGTRNTDSKDSWLEKNDERHQSRKWRHSRQSKGGISDDEGISAKRLKEKSYSKDESELEKSLLKGKPVDRQSSRRSHSSRKNTEMNSNLDSLSPGKNHGFNYADFDSRYKYVVESNEQDRWKPGSPDRIELC